MAADPATQGEEPDVDDEDALIATMAKWGEMILASTAPVLVSPHLAIFLTSTRT